MILYLAFDEAVFFFPNKNRFICYGNLVRDLLSFTGVPTKTEHFNKGKKNHL